jgi:hypothetical protein
MERFAAYLLMEYAAVATISGLHAIGMLSTASSCTIVNPLTAMRDRSEMRRIVKTRRCGAFCRKSGTAGSPELAENLSDKDSPQNNSSEAVP